jgi:hypothetical protein
LQVFIQAAQPFAWTFAVAGVNSAWEQNAKRLEARKMLDAKHQSVQYMRVSPRLIFRPIAFAELTKGLL